MIIKIKSVKINLFHAHISDGIAKKKEDIYDATSHVFIKRKYITNGGFVFVRFHLSVSEMFCCFYYFVLV